MTTMVKKLQECTYGGNTYSGLVTTCTPLEQVGNNGTHRGFCSSLQTLDRLPSLAFGYDGNRCTLSETAAECPVAPFPQGQTELIACNLRDNDEGNADYSENRCDFVDVSDTGVVTGLPSSCQDTVDTCSSTCEITNAFEVCGLLGNCTFFPGSCSPPACTVKAECTTPIRTVGRKTSALCAGVEPVTL